MPLAGSTTVQHGTLGHPTSGCDPKEQLDGASDGSGDGDDCTNGLLRGRRGDDTHQDGSANATQEAQNRGQSTFEKECVGNGGSGSTAVLPLLVSLFKSNYTSSYVVKHHKFKSSSHFCVMFLSHPSILSWS